MAIDQAVTTNDEDVDFIVAGPAMTLAEFNALPEDPQRERMLIRGRLWEKPMTKRTRKHAICESRIAHILWEWSESTSAPHPLVYSGEVGCDFPDLETGVGIDVAVVSAEHAAAQDEEDKYIQGPPLLVVEILSSSDRVEEVHAKVTDYREAGVPVVWIVDPFFETVNVHQPDGSSRLHQKDDDISGDPQLPGLQVITSKLFRR